MSDKKLFYVGVIKKIVILLLVVLILGMIWIEINFVPEIKDVNSYFKEYGFECTEDCSGHRAGYYWADSNYIKYIEDCGGKSQSFIEGCITYVKKTNAEIKEESNYFMSRGFWVQ